MAGGGAFNKNKIKNSTSDLKIILVIRILRDWLGVRL